MALGFQPSQCDSSRGNNREYNSQGGMAFLGFILGATVVIDFGSLHLQN
jgi:hypothetical protein